MTEETNEKFVTICPNCNSKDVGPDFSNAALVRSGITSMKCNHCGYKANSFLEVKADELPPVKEIRQEEKRKLVNTTVGKNIDWWWRITGPPTIALSIVLMLVFTFFYPHRGALLYIGVIVLPVSCVITLSGYGKKIIRNHPILRTISAIVYVYAAIMSLILLYALDLFG